MTPTTEQLKDLLAKVTPGEWRNGKRWQSIIADGKTGHDDDMSVKAYGGHLICESVAMPANAALIALTPALAAEVVQLRSALGLIADLCDDKLMRTVARQALDATRANNPHLVHFPVAHPARLCDTESTEEGTRHGNQDC